jgi:hypothetical protein
MTYEEIISLNKMGFSNDEIMQLVTSDNPAAPVTGGSANEQTQVNGTTQTPAEVNQQSENLQQTPKTIETPKPQTNTGFDTAALNTFNNNIVNLTKALQASNLLTSYMPAPQGSSEDIANNALASIINPTFNNGGK